MSMKFKEFIAYLSEASGIFFRNTLPIIFVTSLTLTLILIVGALIGYISLLTLSPESGPTGLTINFSSYSTTMILVESFAFIVISIAVISIIYAFYSAIISIYAFYIRFKSDDENYQLFFSLVKEQLWKVMKVSIIAWLRVFVGMIFFIIPGIVLAMRYAAINYFVIAENTNFTAAKVKSAEVMKGFKVPLLLFYLVVYVLSLFLDISKGNIVNSAIYSVLYIILSFSFQSMCFVLSSVVIYTICKNEAYKNFVPSDSINTDLSPETTVSSDPPIVAATAEAHIEQQTTNITPTASATTSDTTTSDNSPIVEEAVPMESQEVDEPVADKPEAPTQK